MRAALSAASLAAACLAGGCSVRPLDLPQADGPAASASAPAAPPPAPAPADPGALAEAGRQAIEAAQAFVGERCELGYREVGLFSYESFDRCPVEAAQVAAYGRAVEALERVAAGAPAPALNFVEKAKMFRGWVELVARTGDTRGTVAFYQGLAEAYNAWRPDAAVWVDPPRILALHFGVAAAQPGSETHRHNYLNNYDRKGPKRLEAFRASGKKLVWRFGPQGAEGPYEPKGAAGAPSP
ncbi:MAG TPA: hypothetical protein VFS43_01990 [Polyangiaceae bacterium]|nr:hypothetical protein [Polyangiaceae bacterium]